LKLSFCVLSGSVPQNAATSTQNDVMASPGEAEPRPVRLPAPVALAPGRNLAVRWAEVHARHPQLPDPPAVVAELADAGARAVLDPTKGWLRLYARRFVLGTRVLPSGQGYAVEFVEPLDLAAHARLAHGALRLSAPGWHYVDDARAAPPGCESSYEVVRDAWTAMTTAARASAAARARPGAGSRSLRYDAFCDVLDEVVEATRQVGLARAQPSEQGAVDVAADRQRAAVAALRGGTSANPRLLAALVDGTFEPGRRGGDPEPDALDPDQREALRAALGGPDLLLVHAPAGTGRTRVLVDLVRACAYRGERVLVTASSAVAVDRVLDRLPGELAVVPVDRAGTAASAVREAVLDHAAPVLAQLEPWLADPSPADTSLARLDGALDALSQTEQRHADAVRVRETAVAAVAERFAARLRGAADARDAAAKALAAATDLVAQLGAADLRARAHATGLLGAWYRSGWYRRVAERRQDRLASAWADEASAAARLTEATATADAVRVEARDRADDDPAVVRATADVLVAEDRLAQATTSAAAVADGYRRLLSGVVPAPRVDPEPDALRRFHEWCTGLHPVLRARANLLQDWRAQVAGPPEQLHAELVRDASVVGATCDAVAARYDLLASQEYDLVVVDEAARVPLGALLVPLTRARRAVLVGDHRLPPPVSAAEARHWTGRNAPALDAGLALPDVGELLTTSAFERLFTLAPPANRAVLRHQRRLPWALAELVDAQFYDGGLVVESAAHPVPGPFSAPLAIVDTSDLGPDERAERACAGTEGFGLTGYDNAAEARVVVALVRWYAEAGRDWAVVVPYRAQAQRIRAALGDEAGTADRVGTFDLADDHDVVVYGFTHSNRDGDIGVLDEVRRLNLVMARTREQLVLVGDFTTLRSARHDGFRQLVRRLSEHAIRHGDVRKSRAVSTAVPAQRAADSPTVSPV
jgi:hypothetical protein